MFSRGSLRSISLATVTPSLVMVGEPNFLSRTTLRPLGPSVTFTASASWLTPRRIAWRDCSPYTICFAIDVLLNSQNPQILGYAERVASRRLLLRLLGPAVVDDGEDFVFPHDEVFLTIELDFLARVFPEQDAVAGLDVERD